MIKYKLRGDITVSLNSNDPNKSAKIQIEGDEEVVAMVRDRLLSSYGAFGHLIRETTTPIDLNAALKSGNFRLFQPQIIEGAELVKVYDPKVPPDALT